MERRLAILILVGFAANILVGCGRFEKTPAGPRLVTSAVNKDAPKDKGADEAPNTAQAQALPTAPQVEELPDEVTFAPQSQDQKDLAPKEDEDYSQMIPEVEFKKEPTKAPTNEPTKPPVKSVGPVPTEPVKPATVIPAEPPARPATAVEPQPSQQPVVLPSSLIRDQAVNFIDRGLLDNASSLLETRKKYGDNAPFEVLFPSRNRHFGTIGLVNIIEFLGQYLQSISPGSRLLISDIAGPRGGPLFKIDAKARRYLLDGNGGYVKSHASHQNGLDADIAYISSDRNQNRFFDVRGPDLKKKVDIKTQFEVFKTAVRSDSVELFFIHPDLKKELCLEAYRQGAFKEGSEDKVALETLRRSVRDYGHYNHFHLRMKCINENNPRCKSRADMLPKNHECVFQKKVAAQ